MSKPATYVSRAIVVAAFALEVVACDVYADEPDTVFLNLEILAFAVLAIAGVELVDAGVRRFRRR
jgi:hypothetical protein